MLNFVMWMVAGGALGFLASRIARRYTSPGTLLNLLAGVVGAFGSGLVIKSALTALDPAMARMGLWALVAALCGASLLLVVVNLPVRSRVAVVTVEEADNKPPRNQY